MTLDRNTPDYYQKRWLRNRFLGQLILENRRARWFSFLLFSLSTPYFYLLYLFCRCIQWTSKPLGHRLLYRYTRHYLRCYFIVKGIDFYMGDPVPNASQGPMLIVCPRINDYTSLFAMQLFDFPLIVPLRNFLYRMRAIPFIPWSYLGRLFKPLSYPDQNLDVSLPTVQALLKKGYSCVVYVNQDYANIHLSNTVRISTDFDYIIDTDIPCYFLRLRGFEQLEESSLFRPALVQGSLIEKSVLFEGISDEDSLSKCARVVEYFDFRYLDILP